MFSGSALNRPFVARLLTAILLGAVLSGCSQEKVETKETIRPVKVVRLPRPASRGSFTIPARLERARK